MASLRKSRGLTQERLAQDIGIPRATLAKWESGGLPRSERALALLAEGLGVDRAQILQQWPARVELAGLEKHSLYAAPFPNKSGTCQGF